MRIAFLTTDNREQHRNFDEPEPYFGTAMEALLKGFEHFPDEIEVDVVSCATRRMPAPEKLSENIRFHQPIVPKIGWGRTLFTGCGLAVRKLLGGIRPDLVHAQGTERDCGVSMMMSGYPGLLTIHGHMARIAELTGAGALSYHGVVRKLEAMAVARAEGVVCITNYTKERVGDKARRTWVVPNAVDPEFFGVRSAGRGGYCLCVANVSLWKRQVELIEALDGLDPDDRPELVFLGSVPNDDYGRRFTEMVSGRSWCRYGGVAGREDLRRWLADASMLVLPSTEDNCPMVVLEAMAAGVPVAASEIGGLPDLVDPGVTGLLFDPRDPSSVRAAVSGILKDPATGRRMADVARKSAEERFHPKVIARAHLDIYRKFASKNR